MTGSNVIHLHERLLRPLRLRAPLESIEITEFQRAAIRADVAVTVLAAALATHGLTFTVDAELGVVIHPIEPYNEAG